MKKGIISIIITLSVVLSGVSVYTFGQGLQGKPEVTLFELTLKNSGGSPITEIEGGAVAVATVELNNTTGTNQSYCLVLQISNFGTTIQKQIESGTITTGDTASASVSYTFISEPGTNFSGYMAEAFLWSDMDTMQPIAPSIKLNSDNPSLHALEIDGEMVYANNQNEIKYTFWGEYEDTEYTGGVPTIRAIAEDSGTTITRSADPQKPVFDVQTITYGLTSLGGAQRSYNLNMRFLTQKIDPESADLKSIKMGRAALDGSYDYGLSLDRVFDPKIYDYTVLLPNSAFLQDVWIPTLMNPNAQITEETKAALPLPAAATFTVTSEDGSNTKTYTINHVGPKSSRAATGFANGIDDDDLVNVVAEGSNVYNGLWGYLSGGYNSSNKKVQQIRSVLEFDISDIPTDINGLVLAICTKLRSTAPKGFRLDVYEVEGAEAAFAGVPKKGSTIMYDFQARSGEVHGLFSDKLTSIEIHDFSGKTGDVYTMDLGYDYFKRLKDLGRTKMYIGLEVDPDLTTHNVITRFDTEAGVGSQRMTTLYTY